MHSGLDLINDLQSLTDALTMAVHDMALHGKKYAEAEKKFKELFRKFRLMINPV